MHVLIATITMMLPAEDLLGMAVLGAGVLKPLWHFSGTFHPVVVHFPIALLMVAALLEGFAVLRGRSVKSAALSQTALTCLWLGTAGAIVAATFGWANVNADGGGVRDDSSLIAIHRWSGVALAGLALLTCVASAMARQRSATPRRVLAYRGGVMASAALVGLVGMYGGKITHGADHYDNAVRTLVAELRGTPNGDAPPVLAATPATPVPATQPSPAPTTQPAPATVAADEPIAPKVSATSPVEPVSTTAPTSAPSETSSTTIAAVIHVEYARDVKPIFDTACVKCHGAEKQKSGYRLDDRAAALNAGDSGERPIVPGHASESLLVKLVEGHGALADKRMPTKGPPLTGDQIALIRKWIDQGAE
jgi:uncharacterized membrane protein